MGKSVKPQTHKQAFLPKSHYTRTGFDHQGLVQPWALEAKCLPKSKGVLIAWIVFEFKKGVLIAWIVFEFKKGVLIAWIQKQFKNNSGNQHALALW